MKNYTGDFRSDFLLDIKNNLVPYVQEQICWPNMEAYWYVDADDDEPKLVYGVRQKGSFGDIDLDKDLTVYTFDLDVDPAWLDDEYSWSELSDKEQKDIVADMLSECY